MTLFIQTRNLIRDDFPKMVALIQRYLPRSTFITSALSHKVAHMPDHGPGHDLVNVD